MNTKDYLTKRNIIGFIIVAILVIAIPLSVYLIRQQQIFKSKAAGEPITFVSGGSVSQKSDGTWTTTGPQITLKVSSKLGPPPTTQTSQSENILMSLIPRGGLIDTVYAGHTCPNTNDYCDGTQLCHDTCDAEGNEGHTCDGENTCPGSGNPPPGGCTNDSQCPHVGSECQFGACNNGSCGGPFNLRAGTSCSNGTCDGNGNCVSGGCTNDSQCPASDNPCKFGACNQGACGFFNYSAGTDCGGGKTCDGSGTCKSTGGKIGSAADGPGGCCDPGAADNSAAGCRRDSNPGGFREKCDIANGACTSNTSCRSETGCALDTDCGYNKHCENGQCKDGPANKNCKVAASIEARFNSSADLTVAAGTNVTAAVYRNGTGVAMAALVNGVTPIDTFSASVSGPGGFSKSVDPASSTSFIPTVGGKYTLTGTCGVNLTSSAKLTVTGGTSPSPSGDSCSAASAPDLGATCNSCIAGKMSGQVDWLKSQSGFGFCSAGQLVNYMCNGGVSAENKAGCLAVKNGDCKTSCGGTGTVTTTHYRIAESPDMSGATGWETYTSDPTSFTYTLKDLTPGVKTIFVQFKDSAGGIGCTSANNQSCSAQIELVGSSCSAFSPNGLNSGQIGAGGIKIYSTSDFRGGIRLLDVTRSPSDAVINKPTFTKTSASAPDLTFDPAIDGSGNWFMNIPDNNSTTDDNDYTVSATVTSFANGSCVPFIIRVPKKPLDISCPADITSTQARMKAGSTDTWSTQKSITIGDTISVAGFHNDRIETPASDTVITVTGPTGPSSHVVTLPTPDNIASYKPELSGNYTVTVTTVGKEGSQCTGTATLTVNAVGVTTTSYRTAESMADLNAVAWLPYTAEGMTVEHDFKSTGQKFIFVQFMDSTGKTTTVKDCPKCQAQIKILNADPLITSCSLSSQGNSILLNLKGENFGTGKGIIKSGDSALQVKQWKDDNVQAVLSSPSVGESLSVTVTNTDGQSSPESLCSAISVLNVGASFFCHAPQNRSQANLDFTLVEQTPGVKPFKQKISIDEMGTIVGLTGILQEGHKYKISLKAPKSVRQTSDEFTASAGSTNVPNFILPVGDIFPLDSGDGVINGFDKAELNREWIISTDSSGRKGDFNQDGRVNSVDWACMRKDFGSSNDAEPTAPAAASTTTTTTTTTGVGTTAVQ